MEDPKIFPIIKVLKIFNVVTFYKIFLKVSKIFNIITFCKIFLNKIIY